MTVAVSNTRRQVYVRIMNAMPEDAEVQTLCRKQIDQIDKQAAKTADKYQFVRERAAMLGADGMRLRPQAQRERGKRPRIPFRHPRCVLLSAQDGGGGYRGRGIRR